MLRDYTIQAVLGSGGFGIVYKASHNELDQVVVIKEYLPSELAVREGATVRAKSTDCETYVADGLRRFREDGKCRCPILGTQGLACRWRYPRGIYEELASLRSDSSRSVGTMVAFARIRTFNSDVHLLSQTTNSEARFSDLLHCEGLVCGQPVLIQAAPHHEACDIHSHTEVPTPRKRTCGVTRTLPSRATPQRIRSPV